MALVNELRSALQIHQDRRNEKISRYDAAQKEARDWFIDNLNSALEERFRVRASEGATCYTFQVHHEGGHNWDFQDTLSKLIIRWCENRGLTGKVEYIVEGFPHYWVTINWEKA